MGNSAFKNLKEFFYSVDSKTELIATLHVRDDSDDNFDTFKDVHIELLFSPESSGIRINCKSKDAKRYNELGMENYYDDGTAEFICSDYNHHNINFKSLEICPNDLNDIYITLDSHEVKDKMALRVLVAMLSFKHKLNLNRIVR
ncbi:hypothetical protein [Clostridium beijerinckii]|uniref:hypothetical protein n=1 Tax=Clostridium beijerinckii TaxID=1520 RepID=UPI00080A21B4|nr:hypothetical protein [Clostridium beijerinckii]OCB00408.1 hypothetical protein BGS1_15825 [Clostridium beijerinckii]